MIKKVLFDSIYVNNAGGKLLLDYLLARIVEKGLVDQFYFLLDERGKYQNLDSIEYTLGPPSEKFRKTFYKANKGRFRKSFSFGNVPPPLKMSERDMLFFHNAIFTDLLDDWSIYPFKKKVEIYLKRLYTKIKLKNVGRVVVQTKLMKTSFARTYSFKESEILQLPFYNLDHVIVNPGKARDKSFMYIGDGTKHRNHDFLLNVWSKLLDKGLAPTLHLTITDKHDALLQRIDELKQKGASIVNHGFIPFNELAPKVGYLIHNSRLESFGLTLLEAIKSGCEVIAPNYPYVSEVISPYAFFDPKDELSLVDLIFELPETNTGELESEVQTENKIDSLIQEML